MNRFVTAFLRFTVQPCAVSWPSGGEPLGRLAEIIVLDQFSRNLFRNSPFSFAADGMALVLAQELVKQPDFDQLPVERRDFALLPFMHSESPIIHDTALTLYQLREHTFTQSRNRAQAGD